MQIFINCFFKNESLPTVLGFCSKASVRKIRKLNNSYECSIISDLWVIWNMHIDVGIGKKATKYIQINLLKYFVIGQ